MPTHTVHIIWGEPAVSRFKLGHIDNLVKRSHAVYDWPSMPEAAAFVHGIKVARKPESWLHVTNLLDINKLGKPLKSKLFEAVLKGDLDQIEEILDAGIDPNTRDPSGLTPLHTAAILGQAKVIQVLLNRGADPDLPTEDVHQQTALHMISASPIGEHEHAADLLLGADADMNSFNSTHQTPLMKALEKDNLVLALHLLKKGANLDYEDEAGNSARSIFAKKYSGIVDDPVVEKFAKEVDHVDNAQKEALAKRMRQQHFPTPYNT